MTEFLQIAGKFMIALFLNVQSDKPYLVNNLNLKCQSEIRF